jgi:hypothetical protein
MPERCPLPKEPAGLLASDCDGYTGSQSAEVMFRELADLQFGTAMVFCRACFAERARRAPPGAKVSLMDVEGRFPAAALEARLQSWACAV